MSEKYSFIEAENATVAGDTACAPTVTQMCGWLQVSRSGFYEWRSRPDSAAARRRDDLKLLIVKAFEDSDGTYGYRRVALQLARWGVQAGLELVRGLMRELGLVPCQPRPWRPSTTQQGQAGRHCCIKRFHDHHTVKFPVLRQDYLVGRCADQVVRASSRPSDGY